MNEQLIEQFKEEREDKKVIYSAHGNFLYNVKFYKPFQQGIAGVANFFDNTLALFEEVEKPRREPDYDSESGSQYWYSEEGVIRGSDHWGNGISNCDWALKRMNGKTVYGSTFKSSKSFRNYKYGFVKWQDFLLKSEVIEINGKEVLTTFENKVGRGLVEVDNKVYQPRVIVEWVEYTPE